MTAERDRTDDLPGLAAVADVVDDLARSFQRAGHRLYLVGGVVRDLVLGVLTTGEDIDLTTDARPEQIKDLIRPHATALWTQGERFGTIGATVGGRAVEVTTHRAEIYLSTSRNPAVEFGTSIDEDLVRRDFTVNAMAISLPDGALLDPFGGLTDLEAGLLRTPRSAEESFGDDPLRMLRAARFLPRFGLEPVSEVATAATELAWRLSIVSVERIHDELERLLAVTEPAQGFEFLQATGLLVGVISEYGQCPEALDAAAVLGSSPGSVLVRRAGLLAPLGSRAGGALTRLRYAKAAARRTLVLLDTVDAALTSRVGDEAVRRVIERTGIDLVPEVIDLGRNLEALRAWSEGRAPDPADPPEPFATRFAALSAREDLTDLSPPLSGADVMRHLGLDPGPEVGAAIAALRHRRLVHGPLDRAAALAWLERWASGRPSAPGSGTGR
jgi:poly(A) polymerase